MIKKKKKIHDLSNSPNNLFFNSEFMTLMQLKDHHKDHQLHEASDYYFSYYSKTKQKHNVATKVARGECKIGHAEKSCKFKQGKDYTSEIPGL